MKNVVSGSAETVVQAGEIRDVHFHAAVEDRVPFQLPPAPRRFVSREEELASLGHDPLVVISGPGGVGKTSLALRWLHDRREDFPHGQLYVDLGARTGPADPEEVLEWFLRALGVDRIPVQLGQRAALFRSVTADRRIALLLDNAASAAQVRPLLPASGTVVVTGRWRLSPLALDGARFVDLGPMDLEDSVRVLESVVGTNRVARERAAADELARLCGGLPIALSVVGAKLLTRPRRSLSKEAADLCADRLPSVDTDSVSRVLDLSYVELPERQARVYRLCAWHPGASFGADVAAAMLGEPVYDVEQALGDLIEKNLLTEVGDDRFRYHDLLRVHARRQPEPVHAEAVRRAVEWYLDCAVDADVCIQPDRQRVGPRYAVPRSPVAAPLEWLEAEQPNLVAALAAADSYDWPDLVWQLCEPLWPLFLHGHHYSDWVFTHQRAVHAAVTVGETVAELRLRTRLGMAYVNLHRHDDARAVLEPVLAADDPVSRSTAWSLLGRSHLDRGAPEEALACFRASLDIRLACGRARGIGGARRRIGQALIALGRPWQAIAELEQAELLLTEPQERARARTFLGRAWMDAGDLDRARVLLTSAHDDLRHLPFPLADVFVQLAELAVRGEDVEQARDHYRSALACVADPCDPEVARIRARLIALDSHDGQRAPDVPPQQLPSEADRPCG